MQLTLELTELSGLGRLHQEGFKLESDGEVFLEYCIQVPNCLPYIKILKGPFAGRTFAVNPDEMMQALDETFFTQIQTCRICGCTDDDCSQCIEATGEPCHWVAENLCSRCAPH